MSKKTGWIEAVLSVNAIILGIAVHAAADEMVKTFHQSSVLIQANETTTEFYSGE